MKEKFYSQQNVIVIRKSLRYSHSRLDSEIQDTIKDCLSDLELAGVKLNIVSPASVLMAIKLYCKWIFDYNGKGEDWHTAYDLKVKALSLDSKGCDTDE
ncbi:MAG: hypothetical protein IJ447_02095 [Clostridia bacterium]|nr:hypothetical protein [Clostridia bacterium]